MAPSHRDVLYTPTDAFIAWLQQHRPNAVRYFSKKREYPMRIELPSGRHRITVPGTNCDIEGAADFDRQIDTAELCLVLDHHPDLKSCNNA